MWSRDAVQVDVAADRDVALSTAVFLVEVVRLVIVVVPMARLTAEAARRVDAALAAATRLQADRTLVDICMQKQVHVSMATVVQSSAAVLRRLFETNKTNKQDVGKRGLF